MTAQRFLIVRTSAIGDVVFASPFAAALRRKYPQAHIAWLVEPGIDALIAHDPNIDARILQHLEHGEHGRFMVVDHFSTEILERGWPDLGQRRLHVAKHIGQCVEDAADTPACREPAAPWHSRAERHNSTDLAGSLD